MKPEFFPMVRVMAVVATMVVTGLRGQTGDSAAPVATRPNIILILVNDLRWDEAGFAGHPFLETPHIDRLAREGARFPSAFVTTPDGTASLAGTLSGRHPAPIAEISARNAASDKTFPRMLRDAGYRTALVGHWPPGPEMLDGAGFAEWVHSEGRYTDPLLRTNRQSQKSKGYVTDILTDHAVQFIQRKDDKPYCLVLAHYGLQAGDGGQPPTAADRHHGLYADKVPRRRPGPETLKNPRAAHSVTPTPSSLPDDHIRNRWRVMAAIDDGVGRIIQALEAARQLENTVVILTSDQGYLYGEHGVTGPGRLAYEEAIRIPLVVHHPKLVKRGVVPSQMVLNIDLAPTILDFAQVPVAPTGSSTAGTSLVGLLRGQAGSWRTAFLIEGFASPGPSHPTHYQAVRTANWKYIRLSGANGGEELYDLHADHYELVNLAGRPTARNELRRWSSELAKVLKAAK